MFCTAYRLELLQVAMYSREDIIQFLFMEGFKYGLILCFLAKMFGIVISMRTLKRILKRLGLRRRGAHLNLRSVTQCLQVFAFFGKNCRCVSLSFS